MGIRIEKIIPIRIKELLNSGSEINLISQKFIKKINLSHPFYDKYKNNYDC